MQRVTAHLADSTSVVLGDYDPDGLRELLHELERARWITVEGAHLNVAQIVRVTLTDLP